MYYRNFLSLSYKQYMTANFTQIEKAKFEGKLTELFSTQCNSQKQIYTEILLSD